jgi:hypothetical protein
MFTQLGGTGGQRSIVQIMVRHCIYSFVPLILVTDKIGKKQKKMSVKFI